MKDPPPSDGGSPNPPAKEESLRQVTPFLTTTRSSFPAISRKSISGSSDVFRESGAGSSRGSFGRDLQIKKKPPPLQSPTSPGITPSTPEDSNACLLAHKSELLATLKTTVEGKMLFDPMIPQEYKLGQDPKTGIEVGKKFMIKFLFLLLVVGTVIFTSAAILYLTNDTWECANLCGNECGFDENEVASLIDCEIADNKFFLATSSDPSRYGSVYFMASNECYIKGFCDVSFSMVPVGKQCALNNFVLTPTGGEILMPNEESTDTELVPYIEFHNMTSGEYSNFEQYTPCIYVPWKLSWFQVIWGNELPPVGMHRSLGVQESKSLYMDWGGRGDNKICGKHDYDPTVAQSGGLQMKFIGNVPVSLWNRYLVVVAEVRNDAYKASLTTSARAGQLFDVDVAKNDVSSWGWQTTRLANHATLINNSDLNLVKIKAYQRYENTVIETPSEARLNCNAGELYCENLPLLIQYDTTLLGDHEEEVSITIIIEMNPLWEISYEDIVVSTYKLKPTFTMIELAIRYCMILVTMIVTIYYIYRIRCSPGGWSGLFVEQVWTLYGLIFLILHLNPFYALVLTERNLSSAVARFGWVTEVECAYYVFYCIMCTIVVMVHSSQVNHPKRDLFQKIDLGMKRYSKLALVSHLVMILLFIFQVYGRSEDGFHYGDTDGLTQSLGSSSWQHKAAFFMIIVGSFFIIVGTIRARQVLSTTPYTPARRKQLLIRFVQCVAIPFYVILITSCILEFYLENIVSDTTYYLTTKEQSTPHKWIGLTILTFIYFMVQSLAMLPINTKSEVPLPSSRQIWLMKRWSPQMLNVLNRHGTTYYFMSYAEELEWIMQQSSFTIETAAVTAAIVIAARAVKQLQSPTHSEASSKSVCLPFGLVDDNNFNISLDAMSGTTAVDEADSSLDDSNIRFNEGESKRRIDESMQHMFCLQLACDMAIVCQEVYLNPPLRFLLKTSEIKLSSSNRLPGCCVMAAAAVVPRTLVKSYNCDTSKSKAKPSSPTTAPNRSPKSGGVPRSMSIYDFRETLYQTSARPRPQLYIPEGGQEMMSVGSCSDEDVPTVPTDRNHSNGEDDDSTDEEAPTGNPFNFNPNALLTSTWFGFPNKKDVDVDTYLAGNISRSYMTPDQYGWSLKSIVDKDQNRMMVITKRMTCTDFEDTPFAYSRPCHVPTPKASSRGSKKKKKGVGNEYHTICICFRGTRNSTNVRSDLNIRRRVFKPMMRDYKEEWIGCFDQPPEIHGGFLEIWKTFKNSARKAVSHEIGIAKQANKRIRIVCTGHSLGGAVSILAAYTFKRDHPDIWVSNYNFGTPRMANAAFCRMYEKLVPDSYRITHPSDQIPGHPFKCNLFGTITPRYDHCCIRIRVDDFGNLIINPSWFETVIMDALPFSLIEIFNSRHNLAHAHSMKCYRTSMQRSANWAGHDFGLAHSLDKTG